MAQSGRSLILSLSARPAFRIRALMVLMAVGQVCWLIGKYVLLHGESLLGLTVPSPGSTPFHFSLPVLAAMAGGTVLLFALPRSAWTSLERWEYGLEERPRRMAALVGGIAVLVTVGPAVWMKPNVDELLAFNTGTFFATEGPTAFLAEYVTISNFSDRHPPLVAVLAGIVQMIVGEQLAVVRGVFLGFLAGSTALTYAIGRRLYDARVGAVAALLFLSFRHVLLTGSRVTTDLPVVFFFLLAVWALLRLREAPTWENGLAAGAAIGAGLLTKYTMGLIFPLIGYLAFRDRRRAAWTALGGAVVVAAGVVGAWWGLLYLHHGVGEQVQTIAHISGTNTTRNGLLGLMSEWRANYRIKAAFLQIPSAIGLYALPVLAVGVYRLTQRSTPSRRWLAAWIAAVAVLLFVMLPVERYFLPAFPALAIVGAVGLCSMDASTWRPVLLALLYSASSLAMYV